MTKKELLKAKWMSDFNDSVIESMPSLSGKIDWNTATYFYNIGLSATEASLKYIANNAWFNKLDM